MNNEFKEAEYLSMYPDVAAAVKAGTFKSGYEHYEKHGRSEGRSINLSVHRKFLTKRSSLGAHSNIWQYIGRNFNDEKINVRYALWWQNIIWLEACRILSRAYLNLK